MHTSLGLSDTHTCTVYVYFLSTPPPSPLALLALSYSLPLPFSSSLPFSPSHLKKAHQIFITKNESSLLVNITLYTKVWKENKDQKWKKDQKLEKTLPKNLKNDSWAIKFQGKNPLNMLMLRSSTNPKSNLYFTNLH